MTSQLGQEAPVARATARFVRVTPMKARRVVDLIRYLPTDEALALLRFAPQSASEPVAKVVASAVANAEHNLQLDPAALVVSAPYVDEGPTLKRTRTRVRERGPEAEAEPTAGGGAGVPHQEASQPHHGRGERGRHQRRPRAEV